MSVDDDYPNIARKSSSEVASREKHGSNTIATLAGRSLLSNSGIPLDLNWVQGVRVEKRVAGRLASACNLLHGPDHAFWR